ncbi:Vitamin B12 ABC transporter, substrate-binding protein BtuF [hydrothermal vent metagenome]|uniref:Vitamin B12 ABC transporter, substrate-binding protein BtuF n=1 Tax=hydrothermal vent metagenome TaxID=652676 RepID=A0A3B0XNE7_9ZZZZ
MKIKILLYLVVLLNLSFVFFAVHASVEVTDDKGQIFLFDKPAKRIVSLAPHITELLFSAGVTDQLVATVNYSDYPEAAKKIPRVGGYNKIDMEALMAYKPDLVIAWSTGNSTEQVEKIRSLGIRVFNSEPETFKDIAKNIRSMGRILGTEKTANQVAHEFLKELALIRQQYPPAKPVRVFYQVWNEPLMTLSDEHLVSRVIKLCSGVNVFSDLSVMSPGIVSARVNIEAVIEKDPDVIVAGMTEDRGSWLKQWKKWPVLTAVKNKHVFAIDADLIVRQTPRVLQGARKMCKYLDVVRNYQSASK